MNFSAIFIANAKMVSNLRSALFTVAAHVECHSPANNAHALATAAHSTGSPAVACVTAYSAVSACVCDNKCQQDDCQDCQSRMHFDADVVCGLEERGCFDSSYLFAIFLTLALCHQEAHAHYIVNIFFGSI